MRPMRNLLIPFLASTMVLFSSCGILPATFPAETVGGKGLLRSDLDGSSKKTLVKDSVEAFTVAGDTALFIDSARFNLYAIPAAGGEKIQLTRYAVWALADPVVQDGYAYVLGADGKGLRRVLLDGSDSNPVAPDCNQFFQVDGGWVYYLDDPLENLYRVRPDGTGKQRLVDREETGTTISGFLVVDGWIYFSIVGSTIEAERSCRLPVAGGATEILSNARTLYYGVIGEWIYCSGSKGRLDRIKRESATPGPDSGRFSPDGLKGGFKDLVIRRDEVFYRGLDDVLFRMDADGTGAAPIGDAAGWEITVTDDWVYFVNWTHLYRMKRDGSDRKELAILRTYHYQVTEEALFYIG